MANQLSPQLLAQLFAQESEDPFLVLLTLSHSTFASPIRFVNNTQDIVSRSNTYLSFPFMINFPMDDGETERQVSISFDNVGLTLINPLRSITAGERIDVKVELVLASIPDAVQMSLEDLKISNISYSMSRVQATLVMDDFLSTELGERYTPTLYPGLF